MSIEKQSFGTTKDGEEVSAFVLDNGEGLKVKVIDYGATIVSIEAPDREGNAADVVLGFDGIEGYQSDANPYFGACCGRFANRIANGTFTLDGEEHTLAINNGPNALHGGLVGFDKRVWKAEILNDAVKMTLVSADGEEGYPGALTVELTYSLNVEGELRLEYSATTDKKTVLNLTNHSYFNLAGSGSAREQLIRINASEYTEVDDDATPSGRLLPVADTAMDLRADTPIGARIDEVQGGGYDHNYCLDKTAEGELTLAAIAKDLASGRVMECWTTEPGVQFYTANFLDGVVGKGGAVYQKQGAYCLETQHYPDSPNHARFPSTELAPGETYAQTTIYAFGAE